MAGLKKYGRKVLSATITCLLNSKDGLSPLYCLTRADGTLDLVEGTFPDPQIKILMTEDVLNPLTGKVETLAVRDKKTGKKVYKQVKNETTGEMEFVYETPVPSDFFEADNAIPPTGEKGETFARCSVTLRNPKSPDVKAFMKANGMDVDEFRRSRSYLYNKRDEDLSEEEARLLNEEIKFMSERIRLQAIGCIVEINNVPCDEDESEKAYMKCDSEGKSAFALCDELPYTAGIITRGMSDAKKFRRS